MPILGGGDGNNDVVNSPGDSPSSPSLEHGAECVVGDVGATDQRANNDATTTKQDHHLSSCGSHSSLRSRRKSQPGLAKPVDPQLVEALCAAARCSSVTSSSRGIGPDHTDVIEDTVCDAGVQDRVAARPTSPSPAASPCTTRCASPSKPLATYFDDKAVAPSPQREAMLQRAVLYVWRARALKRMHSRTSLLSMPFQQQRGQDGSDEAGDSSSAKGRKHSITPHRRTIHAAKLYTHSSLQKIREIGQGFFGTVYLMKSRRTHTQLVVKTLKHDIAQDQEAQQQLLAELRLQETLFHPNLLEFKGIFWHHGALNLVAEYIDGGTLLQTITSRKPLSWICRVQYARDIAAAISYLHRQEIIHRDLKSENCLIRTKDNSVVVCDFGLSTKTEHVRIKHQRSIKTRFRNAAQRLIAMPPSDGSDDPLPQRRARSSAAGFLRTQSDPGIVTPTIPLPRTTPPPPLVGPPKMQHQGSLTRCNVSANVEKAVDQALHQPRKASIALKLARNVGTAFYMAPEVLAGDEYTELIDCFSMGIVFAEIISRLFADPDVLPRSFMMIDGNFVFGLDEQRFVEECVGSDCPSPFVQIALECCEVQAKDRPSARNVWEALQALLVGLQAAKAVTEALADAVDGTSNDGRADEAVPAEASNTP
eukprot:m.300604 g.300604  ORF g.300604 m.300604 type:complete len:649 (-) comp19558_c0_seq7:446-2392(-)